MDISNQDQHGSGRHCFDKVIHQKYIHHGRFIHDNHVCIERVFFVFLETPAPEVVRQ